MNRKSWTALNLLQWKTFNLDQTLTFSTITFISQHISLRHLDHPSSTTSSFFSIFPFSILAFFRGCQQTSSFFLKTHVSVCLSVCLSVCSLLYFCTILHCSIRPIKHFPPLEQTLPLSLHTNRPITTLSLYRSKIFLLHINLRSFLSFLARWFLFRVRTCTLVLLEGRKEPEENQFLRRPVYRSTH